MTHRIEIQWSFRTLPECVIKAFLCVGQQPITHSASQRIKLRDSSLLGFPLTKVEQLVGAVYPSSLIRDLIFAMCQEVVNLFI